MRSRIVLFCITCCLYASVSFTREHPVAVNDVTINERPDGGGGATVQKGPLHALPAARQGATLRKVAPPAGSSFRWYGFYDPGTGVAVENDRWTFDHGAADPLEGWRSKDLRQNDFTAFRRITPGLWGGHDNVPAAPVLAGSSSVWVGWFEDEADAACWKDGLGYGNFWTQHFTSDIFFDGTGSETIEFDYFLDTEAGYDFVRVLAIDDLTDAVISTIATFDGTGGTPGAPLHFSGAIGSIFDVFRIRFEFTSDPAYSDEDSLYTTTTGPFGVDDIVVGGFALGVTPNTSDFESGLQGWTATPGPANGTEAGLASAGSYTYDPSCGLGVNGLSGNVLEFHDGTQQHPARQRERAASPAIPIEGYGTDPLNVFAEYNIYADNPLTPDSVLYSWWWSYYPFACPATGDTIWTPPIQWPFGFYNTSPLCLKNRVFANDTTGDGSTGGTNAGIMTLGTGTTVIPAGTDSVRFYFGIVSISSTQSGNFTPVIDNIRVGVSNATWVRHVPSPAFVTIQEAIDEATSGDTILVAAGTYSGAGNINLNFGGKDLVLLSEEGAALTVIDCGDTTRGIVFGNSETNASVVEGFTFRNGLVSNGKGGAVLISNASPTFRNCTIDSSEAGDTGGGQGWGGGIYITGGSPTFTGCTIEYNTATSQSVVYFYNCLGGGVYVGGGASATFLDCAINNNTADNSLGIFVNAPESAQGGGIYIEAGATATLSGCEIASNATLGSRHQEESGGGSYVEGQANFTDCDIHNNVATLDGGAIYRTGGGLISGCLIHDNQATSSRGGGIYSSAALSLTGGAVYNNTASANGGGIFANGSLDADSVDVYGNSGTVGGGIYLDSSADNSSITYVDIHDNTSTANNGGGIYVSSGASNVTFSNMNIHDNTATAAGGGCYLAGPGASMVNSRIQANTAVNGGGLCTTAACTLSGAWITGNLANTNGGGVYATASAGLTLENCTAAANRAAGDGGGVFVSASGDADLLWSILSGNSAAGSGGDAEVDAGGDLYFACSLTDPTFVTGGGTITYDADTQFGDPQFCDPAVAASAPTTTGDFSIATNSPASPSNSPCGTLMGADIVGCSWGSIMSIADVGNDQGRWVRIEWERAKWDEWGATEPVTQYSVWRKILPGLLSVDLGGEAGGPLAPPGDWDFVITVPASAQPDYSTVVGTLCDSTISGGDCYTTFFVRAHTAVPALVFDSPPDSGYSLDNLEPGIPQNFIIDMEAVASWSPNETDEDFDYFTVYCVPNPDTPIELAGIVVTTTDTSVVLPDSTENKYIFVTATDFAGNESDETARELYSPPTGIGDLSPPVATRLQQNIPNPFNPTTTIRFDLATNTHVTLRVYDVAGRLVRTLVDEELPRARHTVTWDARDGRGVRVTSGMYFYRLEAGEFEETKKMIVLK